MTDKAKKLGQKAVTQGKDGLNMNSTLLSKREYFAGLAMQGLLSNQNLSNHVDYSLESISKQAVLQAEHLLEELSKEE